jgi:hypothetical protein
MPDAPDEAVLGAQPLGSTSGAQGLRLVLDLKSKDVMASDINDLEAWQIQ